MFKIDFTVHEKVFSHSSSLRKADLFYMKLVASWGQPCWDHMISWTCLQYLPYLGSHNALKPIFLLKFSDNILDG